MSLSDDRLREMLTTARKATPGPWKVWGMSVMADPVGDSNVDTALDVAHTTYPGEGGPLRTFNAHHIAAMDPPTAERLLTEVLHLREVVRRASDPTTTDSVRTALLRSAAMATPIVWGERERVRPIDHDDSMESTIARARAVRERVAGPILFDEDAEREAQWARDRGGVQRQQPDGSWADAEPMGMQGWKGKAEERARAHGWTRLASLLARWDERGLGR